METPTPGLHTERSFALLLVVAAGAGLALACAALVAGGGVPVAALAFLATAAFGLAADGRSEVALRRLNRPQ